MILIAGVVLSLVSWVGERHSLTKTHFLLLISTSSATLSPVAVKADFRGGQKLCYKNNFKGIISICAFLPHCLIFPLRSQTCKLLFETISDPTTLHFTAEGELTGFDLEVIFALIIQLKRFWVFLLTYFFLFRLS